MMPKRLIVKIDEEKCDGCGLCVPSCEEGAIQIRNGKARLVSETYCDGLGACLGHCPRGAISIIEREAEPFDERAAEEHVRRARASGASTPSAGSCPGTASRDLRLKVLAGGPVPVPSHRPNGAGAPKPSGLANWPVQLHLVSAQAPFLRGAPLLLVADCVPLACPDFHRRFLDGRPVVIGCPKLDDASGYVEKLAQILRTAAVGSLTVLHMEVPCCTGLRRIAEAAIGAAGVQVPLEAAVIAIRGEVLAAGPVERAGGCGDAG